MVSFLCFRRIRGGVMREATDTITTQEAAPRPSLIGGDLRVQGTLKSGGTVHIEGTVEGDVQATSIIVGEKGSVTGNVVTDTIVVYGFVRGNIEARTVELEATAHVIGDTMHQVLRVEKGACLDGNYRTIGKSREGPPRRGRHSTKAPVDLDIYRSALVLIE